MTYEKDIPEFALVPAKEPEERVLVPVTQDAVYASVQVTNITEKPKAMIYLEEDILVPDTRPDLKEILDISGKIRLTSREADGTARSDDTVFLSGDIELQTLYIPVKEHPGAPLLSIGSRISFREPWHTSIAPGGSLVLDAAIEKMDYTVVNERKFRVKMAIGVSGRESCQQKVNLFEGITGEELQTLRETVELTDVALRKKDILTIREDLDLKDAGGAMGTILKQEITAVENYKQAAAEKAIINGFIYVNLLWLENGAAESMYGSADDKRSEDAAQSALRQYQTRVEFTQFIPLAQSGSWSGSNVTFDSSDLRVKLTQGEDGADVLRLEGDLTTWIELYRNTQRELIVDGYHREKDFICDFQEAACRTLVGTAIGETTVREIISLEHSGREADQILGVFGEITGGSSHAEPGKIITEGTLLWKLICRSEDGELYSVRQELPVRCVTGSPVMTGDELISQRIYLKDLWAEKINGKQAELNAAILVSAEMMRQAPFKVLKNPAFEEVQGGSRRNCPMVIYVVKPADSLWSIARHFKSTMEIIAQMNQLEDGRLYPGQKLLILQ